MKPPADERAALLGAARRSWRQAAALAVVALACAVLLGGLSAWFLGAVAIAGLSAATALTFNFHVPGALVRLLAIGRTAARYGERLTGHRAALTDQVVRRTDLFRAMSGDASVRRAGWQLGDPSRLSDYLDDVEDLDYGRLRVDLPAAATGVGLVALLAATLLAAPLAIPPILPMAGLWGLAAARLARTTTSALVAMRCSDRDGAALLGAAIATAVPLRAEAALPAQLDAALAAFSVADRHKQAIRVAQARLDALGGLAGPLAGASVIAAAWLGGAAKEALLVPMFVAFAWLALSESLQGTSRLVVAHIRRRLARRHIERWRGEASAPAMPPSTTIPASIAHAGVERLAPDGRPLGGTVALTLVRGRPTIVVGASGSGKTSLLKQIGGWIGDDRMALGDGATADPAARRGFTALCLHDAAVLADTVRANLFAPGVGDERLWQALETVEMRERVARAGGLDGWISQETLSLGEAQRLNLARALIAQQPLILLDEPTEHLDAAQAQRIVRRLIAQLSDRIVVVSTHHAGLFEGAEVIDLDAARQGFCRPR